MYVKKRITVLLLFFSLPVLAEHEWPDTYFVPVNSEHDVYIKLMSDGKCFALTRYWMPPGSKGDGCAWERKGNLLRIVYKKNKAEEWFRFNPAKDYQAFMNAKSRKVPAFEVLHENRKYPVTYGRTLWHYPSWKKAREHMRLEQQRRFECEYSRQCNNK
jgi:hypothetical protein